ncbi:sensor histidine kinase [Kibdelosporangium philippinense]|uniref:histidine kinase n=1 Tax=Kibdelosporangium philippinense TaxID=211113 RepID=A0ABS8Z8N3_9PSEU|nr:sensor histidine kinase [Kibdelosporangium philippinense]MCE7004175.1 sensor histidine kinase [Kibdelosporangium philippinense]
MGTGVDPAYWRRPSPTPAEQRQDVWIALLVLVGALVAMVLVKSVGTPNAPPLWEQLVWAASLALPLALRRRYPIVVLLLVGAVFIAAAIRAVGDNLMPSIAVFLATYTVGAWAQNRTWARWSRIAVIAAMFILLGYNLLTAIADPPDLPHAAGPMNPVLAGVLYTLAMNLLFFAGAYFFGNMAWLSARRQAELVWRAEELRLSQEQNTRGAIVAERVRIARDLHDVVAHHVSVMGVHAGAARSVLGKDPDVASEALRTVEQTARTAITELRGLLGVLRAEDTEASDTTSSPGLDQLPELFSAAKSAGLEVVHGVYGEPRPVPQGVALSAYRVVQEALTNVVKHAGARRADVRVRFLETALEIEVSDDGRGDVKGSNGFGLLGMRERVAVHGGELDAGPRRDGGFRVRVSLPTSVH